MLVSPLNIMYIILIWAQKTLNSGSKSKSSMNEKDNDGRLLNGRGREIAAILLLSTLLGYLTRVNISVALPFIGTDYGWTDYERGLYGGILLGIFLCGYGFSNIFISPLIDRIGPRRGLIVIMTVWSVITFFTGVIGLVLWAFIAARLFLGLSEGPLFPSASKVTREWYAPKTRTKVNSLYFASLYASNLLAAALLVPLILLTDWRFAFFSIGLFGFLGVALIYFRLQDSPVDTKRMAEPGKGLRFNLTSVRESLRIKGMGYLLAADIATNLSWWGISLWLPTYIIQAKGFTTGDLYWAASLPYIGGIIGLYAGSVISSRTGRLVAVASTFAMLCGLFIFLVIPVHDKAVIILLLSLVFFFIAIMQPNLFSLLQDAAPERLIGGASGLLNGLSVGLGVLGPIMVGIVVAYTSSYEIGLAILAILQVAAGLILLPLGRRIASGARTP
jgi:MFS family permease